MGEFGFIEQIVKLCENLPSNGFEGIGDDCAVLPIDGERSLLFSSDMLVEGVHFLRKATSPFDLGAKSLTVNLSDIAAMGGRPTATLLSLSIPKELNEGWIEEFMEGYTHCAERYGVALIGGDTTASTNDLVINITVIGVAESVNIKRRSAAAAGDKIYVTGKLGASGAGLRDILDGRYETPNAMLHKRPTPRVEEGEWLGGRVEVGAMMDISDGVASDLRHIMSCSGVGAAVELDAIPTDVELKDALCAGEDYELLLTVRGDERVFEREYFEKFGVRPYNIGEITEGNKLQWLNGGVEQEREFMGFTHY